MQLNNLKESPLVIGATEAKRPTAWWLAAILIIAVAVIAIGTLVGALYGSVVPNEDGSIAAQVKELFTNAGALVGLWLWLRFKEGRPFSSVGFRGGDALRKFLTGLAIGTGMITLVMLILLVTGLYHTVPGPAGGLGGAGAIIPALLLVIVWTIQSSTEETLMRGYLVQTSALQLPGWLAVLLPSLLFSGIHFASESPELVAAINIVLFAVLASFVSLRQGSLWIVCGIHAGWNWFMGNVFGVPVSGNPYNTGIFHFGPTETASHMLGGGSFGPENTLVTTLVWGIATFLAYRYFRSEAAAKAVAQPV